MATKLENADKCIIVNGVLYPKGVLRACIETDYLTVWEDVERTIPLVDHVAYGDIINDNTGSAFASIAELSDFVKDHFFFEIMTNVSELSNDVGYLTANQSISFTSTGDITGSASGTTSLSPTLTLGAGKVTTTKVADNAVTHAKYQTISARSILANLNGSTHAVIDTTINTNGIFISSGQIDAMMWVTDMLHNSGIYTNNTLSTNENIEIDYANFSNTGLSSAYFGITSSVGESYTISPTDLYIDLTEENLYMTVIIPSAEAYPNRVLHFNVIAKGSDLVLTDGSGDVVISNKNSTGSYDFISTLSKYGSTEASNQWVTIQSVFLDDQWRWKATAAGVISN